MLAPGREWVCNDVKPKDEKATSLPIDHLLGSIDGRRCPISEQAKKSGKLRPLGQRSPNDSRPPLNNLTWNELRHECGVQTNLDLSFFSIPNLKKK